MDVPVFGRSRDLGKGHCPTSAHHCLDAELSLAAQAFACDGEHMDLNREHSRQPRPRQSLVLPETAFPAVVTQTRCDRGWAPLALARQANVALASVRRLEEGQPLGCEDLGAICSALGLAFPPLHRSARLEFASLLWDRRRAAGMSRLKLARLAKLSDATIKFVETAQHQPSRSTCLLLMQVKELGLTWADVEEFAGRPPRSSCVMTPDEPRAMPAQVPMDVAQPPPTVASELRAPAGDSHQAATSDMTSAPARITESSEGPIVTVKIEIYADRSVQIRFDPVAASS